MPTTTATIMDKRLIGNSTACSCAKNQGNKFDYKFYEQQTKCKIPGL